MKRRFLKTTFFCIGLLSIYGTASATPPAAVAGLFTTQSIVLRVDKKTTETWNLLTTDGNQYLQQVLPSLPEPNASIVRLMLQYPTDGSHDYWWPRKAEDAYDGSTTNILLNGQVVMKGEPKGHTFCCGLTLEVFYRLIQSQPQLAAKVTADPAKFKSLWFCKNIFTRSAGRPGRFQHRQTSRSHQSSARRLCAVMAK